jgi:MFS transporter, DHA1 family, quinolone resistance protein
MGEKLPHGVPADRGLLRALICLMFLMFAMTSDGVGEVIPKLREEFHLDQTSSGAFHYVLMAAIALGALLLGFLSGSIGRKATIMLGLALYGIGCALFAVGKSFGCFLALVAVSGVGISVFKTGALALVGDISPGSREHTATMNLVEGFFGVGAILGPALVTAMLATGWSWKGLYVVAAGLCAVLLVLTWVTRFPADVDREEPAKTNFRATLRMLRNPHAQWFSGLIGLYVATEAGVYVWLPTYLRGAAERAEVVGPAWLVAIALTLFFVFRAAGRFLGGWLLQRFRWNVVLGVFGMAIFACFAGSWLGGVQVAAWLLPLSGLFMSMLYPTLNSKGISCFPRNEHGAAAGVTLFCTALAAVLGPWLMAAAADRAGGNPGTGFGVATVFATLLAMGLLYNWLRDPAGRRLAELDGR